MNRIEDRTTHLLVLPGVHLLDLAGPAQVFYEAAQLGGRYRVRYCGIEAEAETAQGPSLARLEPLGDVAPGDRVVVAGTRSDALETLGALTPAAWLRDAHSHGALVGSVCTGAFALGEAGLLDGRSCTTHWKVAAKLQASYPRTRVLRDRLFVRDGGVITSAGITSGIDMALSVVEADHGPLVAARVAREMVVYLRRDGTSTQQSIYLDYRTHLHPGVHRAQDWLVQHPAENPTLDELARVAGMSPRNLTRAFRAATGITLKTFSTRLKLEVARNLMHDPNLNLDGVAARCGYGDARQLRRLWQREFGESPSQWKTRRLRSQAS